MSVPGGGLRVDLKSKEQKQGISFDFGWIIVVIIVILSGIICYFIGANLKGKIARQRKQLQTLNNQIKGFNGIKAKLAKLGNEISLIRSKINRLRALRYDPLRYSLLLVRLADDIPKNVWINNLSVQPNSHLVSLSGSSLNESGRPPLAAIAGLIMNLQNDPQNYFSNVQLLNTSSSGKYHNIWGFSLKLNYRVPLFQNAPPPKQSSLSKTPLKKEAKNSPKEINKPQLKKSTKGGKP
jgi:Tfp pilus assembly protein PilN